MKYYLERAAVDEGVAGAGAKYGTALSTRTYFGDIVGVVYVPSSSPVVAAGSAMFKLFRGSSAGDILCKSSSSCGAAQKYYAPRQAVIHSSGLATSSLSAYPLLVGDKMLLARQSGSSDGGQGLGITVDVILRGSLQF